MKFSIDAKLVTVGELMDAGEDLRGSILLMSRFMVDAKGEAIEPGEALKMLRAISVEELLQVKQDFLAAFSQAV
jgi:hypothetical protein